MLLRSLIILLSPYTDGKPRSRRKPGLWQRVRRRFYDWCLLRLAKHYRRYAYVDLVETGRVKVLQECRDHEFEKWVKQCGYDIGPHLQPVGRHPAVKPPLFTHRPFYGFFHFSRQLFVFEGKETLLIDRTDGFGMNSDMRGQLKVSTADDILLRTSYKIPAKEKATTPPTPKTTVRPDPKPVIKPASKPVEKPTAKPAEKPASRPEDIPKPRRKVTLNPGGAPIPPKEAPPKNNPPKVEPPKAAPPTAGQPPQKPVIPPAPSTRQMQGVEVDESF